MHAFMQYLIIKIKLQLMEIVSLVNIYKKLKISHPLKELLLWSLMRDLRQYTKSLPLKRFASFTKKLPATNGLSANAASYH